MVKFLPLRDKKWGFNLETLLFGVLKIFTLEGIVFYILQGINKVETVTLKTYRQVNVFANRQSCENKRR